jgi:hypothetical protein
MITHEAPVAAAARQINAVRQRRLIIAIETITSATTHKTAPINKTQQSPSLRVPEKSSNPLMHSTIARVMSIVVIFAAASSILWRNISP